MEYARLVKISTAMVSAIVLFACAIGASGPVSARSADGTAAAGDSHARLESRITEVSVAGTQPAGTFAEVSYVRTWGTVTGIVASGENVRGLASLPQSSGGVTYTAEFEIIAPEKAGTNTVILVEAENRGSPVLLDSLSEVAGRGAPSEVQYAAGFGNGFLFARGTSYARVQWQAGISAGIPGEAQGVGEVVIRDFGRLLSGRTKAERQAGFDPGAYRTLILGGISQSGFFVNTFLAEGFNVDPTDGRGVYAGAIAVDGTGNWLALNQLGAASGSKQYPYVVPDGKPLAATAILKRPGSDPFYIDIANYTDFYRLRASVTDGEALPARARRYDWPSPHAAVPPGRGGPGARCNGGVPVELNPISYAPYLRAVTFELEHALGARSARNAPALPPTTLFRLGPAPTSREHFNPLPGVALQVPTTDADAQPAVGVRFPEVEHPIGRPTPVSLPPVVTTAINETCGNMGEWQPLTAAELASRFGDQSNYLRLYAVSLDKLIAGGFLLASDRAEMLQDAALLYDLYAKPGRIISEGRQ